MPEAKPRRNSNADLQARVANLQAENAELGKQIGDLQNENAELGERVAIMADSDADPVAKLHRRLDGQIEVARVLRTQLAFWQDKHRAEVRRGDSLMRKLKAAEAA